jgi:membrane protein
VAPGLIVAPADEVDIDVRSTDASAGSASPSTGTVDRLERRHQSHVPPRLEKRLGRNREAVDRQAAATLARHPRAGHLIGLAGRVAREQSQERVGLAASGAAFWFVITVFPAAIAAVTIFGLVVDPHDVAKDLGSIASSGPDSLGANLSQQLHRAASTDRTGLSVGLAVSVVLAIWTASAGVYNLGRAVRVAYGLGPDEYVRARLRALVGAFAIIVALGVVAIVSGEVSALLATVPAVVVGIIGVPLLLVIVAAIVAGAYHFAIDDPIPLRDLAPGALFSSVGLLLVGTGFGAYVAASTRYTAVYGALAGVAVAMIASYLATYVVLIGAVINVQLTRGETSEAEDPEAPHP